MDPLDDLHRAELAPILSLQDLPGWMEPVMEVVSLFGTDTFFLLLLPILYWCVNPRLGLRLSVVILAASWTNAVAKLLLHQPRPYWIDAGVKPLSVEGTFGLPSGHAQIAAATWGALAAMARRPWAWWSAGVLIVLIALSRVYLGVHFVSDVVVGIVLGFAVLALVLKYEEPAAAWWRRQALGVQLAASAVISGAMIGVAALARAVVPVLEPTLVQVDPLNLELLVAMAGSVLGMLAGASVMYRLGWFDVGGPTGQRVARWAIGSVVVGMIWYGLRELLPPDDVLRYLRYAVLSLWIQLGAPLTFIKLGLMSRAKRPEPAP